MQVAALPLKLRFKSAKSRPSRVNGRVSCDHVAQTDQIFIKRSFDRKHIPIPHIGMFRYIGKKLPYQAKQQIFSLSAIIPGNQIRQKRDAIKTPQFQSRLLCLHDFTKPFKNIGTSYFKRGPPSPGNIRNIRNIRNIPDSIFVARRIFKSFYQSIRMSRRLLKTFRDLIDIRRIINTDLPEQQNRISNVVSHIIVQRMSDFQLLFLPSHLVIQLHLTLILPYQPTYQCEHKKQSHHQEKLLRVISTVSIGHSDFDQGKHPTHPRHNGSERQPLIQTKITNHSQRQRTGRKIFPRQRAP